MFQLSGDIRFVYSAVSKDTLGPADIHTADRDITNDETFETAVLITIGSDARAKDTDVLPSGFPNRGGYWGSEIIGRGIGCRLWLLGRSKLSSNTVVQAQEILEDGFAWLVDDGIAKAVTVETYVAATYQMNIVITVQRPDTTTVTFAFYANWETQLLGGL